MRLPLPRALLSLGRQTTTIRSTAPQEFLSQRFALLSTNPVAKPVPSTFKAHASYKLNPLEKRAANPNVQSRISNRSRPVKRPFVPPPTKTEEELALLPYIVRRTPYAQLPVYRKWMSGGNRVIILVKKVDGDRRRLVEDLQKAFELEKDDIRLNPTTQHIEIKGNRFEQSIDWLLAAGY
ncbi:hypothetical protein G7046_g6629 [Stylonectria norvegica]|nr:hypothetical protein G7046_g6629 [Stylonectria norvegica]